ncbi:MAG TPA: NAD-dependent epimerase/dehydratase family protein, partial [Terriglobia bacterium]|nr:NAD-dependent epimerase/dehydratase family protein [Terriglobia bacterium]
MSSGRKILVTGGAGFIGSHLLEALLSRGDDVAALDNFDDFYPSSVKHSNLQEVSRRGRFRFYEADIRDDAKLREILAAEKPDAVIHLAARAGVRPSIEQPELYTAVNVDGTVNLLSVARDSGVSKFIFISSSSVYGATARVPFVEDQYDLKPLSPYAATKLAGELICYTYSHLFGLRIICLRLFTVYGPRQRPDLAIHKFAALMEAGKPVPLFGDGSSSRDYTFVEDTVGGILSALEYQTGFDVFNLGNCRPVKLVELVRQLEEALGKRAVIEWLPPQ